MDELTVLINNSKLGDKESFGKIYQMFYKRIYRFCAINLYQQEIAQDICQETFVKAWRSIDSFQFKQGGSFQAFLFRIARNLIIDFSRKKKNVSLENYQEIEQHDDIEERIDQASEEEHLHKVLDKLDSDEKQLIVLRYFEDLSFSELSQVVNIKEGALRVKVHRILKKIKEEFKNE